MVDNMSTLNSFQGTPSKVNRKGQAFDLVGKLIEFQLVIWGKVKFVKKDKSTPCCAHSKLRFPWAREKG
jgi:hypothetical protein